MANLAPVIEVDVGKCLNCHACISVCPVKFCNDGSEDVVHINHNMCIACGRCISACTHDARLFADDFDIFIDDIIAGKEIIAIVAPAIAAGFPGKYLKLNTLLRKLGVKAIFDVSFGAELATKSYIEYLEAEKPKTVIAQPCAAIVTYIELYQPELIKYLAPVDSPMVHTMKMVKNYYSEFKDCKVAVISPCNAKKREFEETGYGDYNIAQKSLIKFLEENNTNLDDFPETDFDNPPAERAVLFSSPGGLLETARRWNPEIESDSRKIEGNPLVYEYFKTLPTIINDEKAPLLIDCLSCEYGCNGGPLTITKDKPQDEVEYWVKERAKELKAKYLNENKNDIYLSRSSIESQLEKYWDKDLYNRTYTNLWENVKLDYPTKTELKDIFKSMHKYSEEDIKNCSSCGYNSCESMAVAIKNKLNKPENCHYYLLNEAKSSYSKLELSKERFANILETMLAGFLEIDLDQIIVDANPAMRKILQKSDIIGKSILEFIDKGSFDEFKSQLNNRQKGEKASYQLVFKQSEGKKRCCLINATPKFDFETHKVSGSFALITDITELKEVQLQLQDLNQHLEEKVAKRTEELTEAMEELKQVNEEILQQKEEIMTQRDAIADSEKRAQIILRSIPDAVFIINKEDKVTFWNNAMEKLTGIKAIDMIGKSNKEYSTAFYGKQRPMLIDFAKMPKDFLEKNYENIQKKDGILKAEAYTEHLGEQKRYLIGIATAIHDIEGKYEGAIEVIHDETEKREALEKLILQKRELEDKQVQLDDKIDQLMSTTEIMESMNLDLQKQHQEIESKNEILESQKDEITQQNSVLEEQKIELIEQQKSLQARNKNINNSIEYAKRIQDAALKSTLKLPFKDHFVLFRPKDIVSGDFYFTKKFFNYTVIVAADCTGHGVPGAFMSLLGISFLNEITNRHYRKINRTGFNPAKILEELRDNIIKTLNQKQDIDSPKDGMDIALCIYDEETKELQFSGAYNPLLLIRNNEITITKGDNMPIGIHLFRDTKSNPFTNHKIQLLDNDIIYLFSDGFQDQFGEKADRKFLRANFYKLLQEIHHHPMKEQKILLETHHEEFRGENRQTDDILVIGLKV